MILEYGNDSAAFVFALQWMKLNRCPHCTGGQIIEIWNPEYLTICYECAGTGWRVPWRMVVSNDETQSFLVIKNSDYDYVKGLKNEQTP